MLYATLSKTLMRKNRSESEGIEPSIAPTAVKRKEMMEIITDDHSCFDNLR